MHRQQRDELARRQQRLLLRSAELRDTLAQQTRDLRSVLALADQLRVGVHWLRQHPVLPLATLAWLALRPPRRLLRWIPSALAAWHLLRRAGQWLGRSAGRPR
ncbi:MAG: YqjK family protein [Hylemonella sp.]|nr:YqjK family protein [Hylemonella sp.]